MLKKYFKPVDSFWNNECLTFNDFKHFFLNKIEANCISIKSINLIKTYYNYYTSLLVLNHWIIIHEKRYLTVKLVE